MLNFILQQDGQQAELSIAGAELKPAAVQIGMLTKKFDFIAYTVQATPADFSYMRNSNMAASYLYCAKRTAKTP